MQFTIRYPDRFGSYYESESTRIGKGDLVTDRRLELNIKG